MKIKESDIQKDILDYLDLMESQGKCYYFRSGAGMIKTQKGGMFKSGRAGCPDISIVITGGRYIGCEVKAPGKERNLSPHQKDTAEMIDKLDGVYMIVSSLKDFIKYFNQIL